MANTVNGTPDGLPTVTPFLAVDDALNAMDYYIRLFAGVEICRMTCPQSGKLMHGEIRIGNSQIYLSEPCPDFEMHAPGNQGTSVVIHVYVPDVDATHGAALDTGATSMMPPADMFWGDRFAKIRDPFGHVWTIATRKEDLTPDEIQQRMLAAYPAPASA